MDKVFSLLAIATENWKYVLTAIVVTIVGYFVYRKFWASSKQGFTTLGGECDPQIENSCGKGGICQSDESGTKGVCFPLPEEEAAAARDELVAAASEEEESAPQEVQQEEQEESSS